jgi:hypothetical protein
MKKDMIVKTIRKNSDYLEIRGEKNLKEIKKDIENESYMNDGIKFLADMLADYYIKIK